MATKSPKYLFKVCFFVWLFFINTNHLRIQRLQQAPRWAGEASPFFYCLKPLPVVNMQRFSPSRA